jgi:hypothetical protein
LLFFGILGGHTLPLIGFFVYLYYWLLTKKDGGSECCDVCTGSKNVQ